MKKDFKSLYLKIFLILALAIAVCAVTFMNRTKEVPLPMSFAASDIEQVNLYRYVDGAKNESHTLTDRESIEGVFHTFSNKSVEKAKRSDFEVDAAFEFVLKDGKSCTISYESVAVKTGYLYMEDSGQVFFTSADWLGVWENYVSAGLKDMDAADVTHDSNDEMLGQKMTELFPDDIATLQNVKEILSTLPENRSDIFYSKNADTELLIYCNDDEKYRYDTNRAYIHLFVNGTEHILDNLGKSFYLREAVPPWILWYDFNGDEVEDFIFGGPFDRYGWLHYLFMSTEEGGFENKGCFSWNWNEGEDLGLSYVEFPYEVTLLDDFKVQIEMETANINEIYELEQEKFVKQYAIPLEMYDGDGKVTDKGKAWDFISNGLYDGAPDYRTDEEGNFILSVPYYIGTGYSDLALDCGFIFDWKIDEEGYELVGVSAFQGEN